MERPCRRKNVRGADARDRLTVRAGTAQDTRPEGAPGAATDRRSKCQAGRHDWARSHDALTEALPASSRKETGQARLKSQLRSTTPGARIGRPASAVRYATDSTSLQPSAWQSSMESGQQTPAPASESARTPAASSVQCCAAPNQMVKVNRTTKDRLHLRNTSRTGSGGRVPVKRPVLLHPLEPSGDCVGMTGNGLASALLSARTGEPLFTRKRSASDHPQPRSL